MNITTTNKILNNEAVDCSGFMWSDRIEYKPLPPNGGMLIRTREPITPEYEFTISKDAIAPTCPKELIMPHNVQMNWSENRADLVKLYERVKEERRMYKDSIIKIKEIVPNKVYEYRFVDGDIQKTVCSDSDQFSMEDSITIAYAKHFMGGSGKYNRAVDKAMKLFTNQKAAEEKAKKEAEAAKVRQEKKAKKRAERIARKREAEIELQAEAYRRALKSMKEE